LLTGSPPRPDLIPIDILLPKMAGFEVARFVRRLDDDDRTHIAMITAIFKNVRYDNEARMKYGIDDYVLKPPSDAALAAIVHRVKSARSKHDRRRGARPDHRRRAGAG